MLVRKKDGRLRFCIDLRKLNNRTVKDSYSLPRIETLLDTFLGSTIFTTLDLKAGYWQVEMAEECKAFTAFTCGPLGFYECETMPFGATNVMYFSSGSVPQYDINNLINSTQNKLNL